MIALADQLAEQGKTDEALTHYEQAARVFPRDERIHRPLGVRAWSRRANTIARSPNGARPSAVSSGFAANRS